MHYNIYRYVSILSFVKQKKYFSRFPTFVFLMVMWCKRIIILEESLDEYYNIFSRYLLSLHLQYRLPYNHKSIFKKKKTILINRNCK